MCEASDFGERMTSNLIEKALPKRRKESYFRVA
jgi:hypothetical protein